MAETTIDALSLRISADASKASESLERLSNTLISMAGATKSIETGKILELSSSISALATSSKRLSEIKKTDFNRLVLSLNQLANINFQGVSDTSRILSTLASNLSSLSMVSFDVKGVTDIANAIAKLGRGTVTQAVTNIPLLTSQLRGMATALSGLKVDGSNFESIEKLATSISKLGGKAAGRAADGNIQKLATTLKNMMATLSTAPKVSSNIIQMTEALAKLASTGSRAGTATKSLSNSFNLLSRSSKSAQKSSASLAAAFGKFYATWWLLIRAAEQFKKAIDISSNLTEVQNVVDVTFGQYADELQSLADISIQQFGMSELTTKQVASRFQAMGTAMGFARGEMADMSIELTKLTADMASFYNESQADVAQRLQSIFTGETEPLMLAA